MFFDCDFSYRISMFSLREDRVKSLLVILNLRLICMVGMILF